MTHTGMQARRYGQHGPWVVLLHGGPAAPGSMAPVARRLADSFRVLETLERRSTPDHPLTVAGHVADLHAQLCSLNSAEAPALVGSSWGAMLALAYAAAHPAQVGRIVLVGCGTFDPQARAQLQETLKARIDKPLQQRLELLSETIPDPDQCLAASGELLLPAYSHDLISSDLELLSCDARGHQESWQDMLRLQAEGIYPATFAAIRSPVLMLHGALDPHPGRLIDASLRPFLPQLKYFEWRHAGHYLWLERACHADFLDRLRSWLSEQEGRSEH